MNSQLWVAKTNELLICASYLYAGSPCLSTQCNGECGSRSRAYSTERKETTDGAGAHHSRLCSDEMLCLTQADALKVSGCVGSKPAMPSALNHR